ncbi:hypothetical protein [Streptomyces sp. NPDC055210]
MSSDVGFWRRSSTGDLEDVFDNLAEGETGDVGFSGVAGEPI